MSYKYVSPFIASLQVMLPKSLKPKTVKSDKIKYALGYEYVKPGEGLTKIQSEILTRIKEKHILLNKDIDTLIDKLKSFLYLSTNVYNND